MSRFESPGKVGMPGLPIKNITHLKKIIDRVYFNYISENNRLKVLEFYNIYNFIYNL